MTAEHDQPLGLNYIDKIGRKIRDDEARLIGPHLSGLCFRG